MLTSDEEEAKVKTLAPDDALLADTRHARLMRDALKAGILREWRAEHAIEALLVLYTTEAATEAKKLIVAENIEKLARAGYDLLMRYAELMPDDQADALYDLTERVVSRRRTRLKEAVT